MPRMEISGLGVEYELLGEPGAHAVALVPGGRFSMQVGGMHELAEALVAGGKRVLLLDRPNCGVSDISFDGESESQMQAQVLTALIRALDLGPTAIGGRSGSASGSAPWRAAWAAASGDTVSV